MSINLSRFVNSTNKNSKMSDFQGHVRIKGMEIPVIDVSKSEVMNSIATWLKKKIK